MTTSLAPRPTVAPSGAPSERARRRLRRFESWLGRWASSIPFTWTIAGVATVVSVLQLVFHASLYRILDGVLSQSFDSVVTQHHWFAPVTSVLIGARALHIVVLLPLILVVLGAAERLMGTWRTIVVYLSVAILGGILGVLVEGIGLWLGLIAAEQVRSQATIDPVIPIVGTIMAASAFTGPLLRRRIRLLGFAGLLMFVLYSGEPRDLYRVIAAVAGLIIGSLWTRRVNRTPATRLNLTRSSHRERRSLLAALVAITAVGPLITIITPSGFGPLQPLGLLFRDTLGSVAGAADCAAVGYSDACADSFSLARLDGPGPVLVTVLPLVVLVIAAIGILRGRRVALWLAVSVNVFLSVLGIAYYGVLPALGANTFFDLSNGQFDQYSISVIISIALPLVIAALLIVNLRIFPTEFSEGATPRFFLGVGVAFIVIALVYLALALMFRAQFDPVVSLSDLLTDLPERFMPVGFLSLERVDVFPVGDAARFVYGWVGPAFWFSVIVGAILSISHVRLGSAANATAIIRSLLYRGGRGSLSWMATWPGNHYWFSDGRTSAVAYRVVNGVAIALGEPLGEPDDRADAIRHFTVFCTNHGWTPVFYVVSGAMQPVFDELQWSLLQIAEEATIDPRAFSLQGRRMQDIRTSINKAVKTGVRAELTAYHNLTLPQIAQIRDISEGWIAEKDLPEMGFTLGGVDELTDPEVTLTLAFDDSGTILAVTSWLPTYRDSQVIGWTLDFMRRRQGAMNGIMEFTIAETVLAARDAGLEFVSLSAAPLAHTESAGAGQEGARAAVLGVLGRALEPIYGFRSLLVFKQKFRPRNVPLYLAYADPLSLPAVGVALTRAYVPTFSARHALGFLSRSA
ncbi:bifunctional lysylphosphatidylglycerol flippase/synthetase MprF [Subtercola frigoramans]|uniref:Lysylphosphatidylglycerol synthetase-like protein (DUF2156 family) n=1 Tax=Subtercola frigoramans TaxID=120298 RepID=A0ABS2L4L5_9MICO|nr:DUF2156 domain-containing protein [Subtercola frigoramans]MBM7472034.1 lysylphosphatidylglycerol synthetase-like protein (DUF2156 family) [Subtercola frigoramans]